MSEFEMVDGESVRLDLIPPQSIIEVGKVFTFGANKHGNYSWMDGIPYGESYAACMRHLMAFQLGRDFDTESGLPNIAHAIARLMMLLETLPEWDDRPQREKDFALGV